jgi:hypothetical protein
MSSLVRAATALFCFAVLMCAGSIAVADDLNAPATMPQSGPGESLAAYLAPDGTLALPEGFSGSLDPKGFRMAQGPGEKPRFVPESVARAKLFGVPSGCNGYVRAIAVSPSGLVYLGGEFTACEDARASFVVSYDPQTMRFQPLGNGVDRSVFALAVVGGDLYVGGGFTQAGGEPASRIARWDGSAWSSLGSGAGNGVSGVVLALAWSGNELFVGGSFSMAGGQPANHIARWNGSAWSSLGDAGNGVNSYIEELAVLGSDLYVAGPFITEAGGQQAIRIARWNGSAWSSLGSGAGNGVNDGVFALAVSGSDLYVAGGFTQAGGQPANRIARWNGMAWSSLGSGAGNGVNNDIYAIAPSGNDLYIGGAFNQAGGRPAKVVARWDGSAWSSLSSGTGNGVGNSVLALAVSGSNLYVGGFFTEVDGQPANRIARWDGSAWSSLGSGAGNGVNGIINALAVSGSDLYVGGHFTEAGGQPANWIARWNGSTWSSLGRGAGNGVNDGVFALAVAGSDLYVGGFFTEAGGQPANRIARWNGSAWSSLGSGAGNGVNFYVYALAMSGSDLYVGGQFTQAGGRPANAVARWNGEAWSSLGSGEDNGVDDFVDALAVAGADLYVGGRFTEAGGKRANNVARWNGSAWSSLSSGGGNGVNSRVIALAVSGSDLYVGGEFSEAGGHPASRIARWNGSSWSSLGSGAANGVNDFVRALAVSGSDLFVGGDFSTAGGHPSNGLARWNDNEWKGLATDEPRQFVRAVTSDVESLFVGGSGLAQTPLPELQTRAFSGLTGNAASTLARTSRTGDRVVFSSRASDLTVANDNFSDIYLRDTATGQIVRISQPTPTAKGLPREEFSDPSIAPAGNTVAYSGTSGQVFATFGGLGRTASTSRGGIPGNGDSGRPMVPGAGSAVLLDTTSTNLLDTPDGNGAIRDIVAKDLNTGAVSLITVGPTGQPANGDSFGSWASDDGRTVAFWSLSTNLSDEPVSSADASKMGTIKQVLVSIPGGMARSATYVSRNPTTSALGNGDSINVRLTPDGRFGVFESVASNLVAEDTNGVSDIFRFEVEPVAGGRLRLVNLERVSLSRYGFQGNGPSYNASISDDGQFITFQTDATNLIELDRNDATDILVKWMVTKEVVRLSRTVDGEQPNGDSIEPTISGDGSTIVYGSAADNLTANDDNGVEDIFAVRLRESDDSPAIVTPLDEPTLQQVVLPTPNPPNASCPAGFYIATVEDGPGTGVSNGAFGMELLLDQPGTRKLAGGLNFGGLVDVSQRGFAAVNIANAGNESQRLNVSLTGGKTPSGALPARVIIERRSGSTSVQVFEADVALSGTPFQTSIVVPPGFYVASVTPQGFAAEAAGGEPEGRFLFSLTTSFLDRPGGSFQGGAVVGGYHASNPFGGSSGFASFCLATPHTVSAKVLSAPTYGERGARDLRLSVLDQARNEIAASPGGGGN